MDEGRRQAKKLAREFIEKGDPTGWFEPLYSEANGDSSHIPWVDFTVNQYLREWTQRIEVAGSGKRALVVGCGLGDDAEAVADLGFETVAFDISASAIEWCRRRFPASHVDYRVCDVLAPPEPWANSFDFVFEAYTLQVLPPDLRRHAVQQLAKLLAPGGTLLVLARRRDSSEDVGTAPWTMLKEDLDHFKDLGLREISFEDFRETEPQSVRRFRAEYRRRQHLAARQHCRYLPPEVLRIQEH